MPVRQAVQGRLDAAVIGDPPPLVLGVVEVYPDQDALTARIDVRQALLRHQMPRSSMYLHRSATRVE